jgi:hypothetical protein
LSANRIDAMPVAAGPPSGDGVEMVVAGAPIADQVRPASAVRAIAAHEPEAHGTAPRTNPSSGDTNVTERGENPAGTADASGVGSAVGTTDGVAGAAVGTATVGLALGGAEAVKAGVGTAVPLAEGVTDADGDPTGVDATADGDGDAPTGVRVPNAPDAMSTPIDSVTSTTRIPAAAPRMDVNRLPPPDPLPCGLVARAATTCGSTGRSPDAA